MRGQNKVLKEMYDTERKQIEQLFQQRERQQLLLEKLLVKERPAHQAGTVQRPVHAVQPLRRVQRRTEATPPQHRTRAAGEPRRHSRRGGGHASVRGLRREGQCAVGVLRSGEEVARQMLHLCRLRPLRLQWL